MSRPRKTSSGQSAQGNAQDSTFGGAWPGGGRVRVVALDGGAEDLWRLFRDVVQASADLRAISAHGGSGLALAAFVAATRSSAPDSAVARVLPEPAFAISVGDAVRRGLPTAARATITGRAPLRSGLVEAPFGGQFARSFARSTDVLLVFGSDTERRAVIRLDGEGTLEVGGAPFDARAETPTRAEALPCRQHALLVGPAAEVGLPFANLGSWSAPGASGAYSAPSLVGRGGLGLTVAAAGVVAITVEADGTHQLGELEAGTDLRRVLEASPRLITRAKGGTLELSSVRAPAAVARGESISGAAAMRPKKHGCEGCPTPCGWQFERPAAMESETGAAGRGDTGVGGRFAALQGFLVAGAGPESMEGAMAALHACNVLGVDARSAALLVGEDAMERDSMSRKPAATLVGEFLIADSPLHRRALALRPGGDVEPVDALMPGDLAGRIGVAFAARGPEPLRSLSVMGLSDSGATTPERRDRLARDLRLAGLTDDEAFNAGVIAHWHECYSAALDLTGFCAFSGSALLADGVLTLDGLSQHVSPGMGGAEWLAAGSAVVALHRELNGEAASKAMVARFTGAEPLPEAAVRGYFAALHNAWRNLSLEPDQVSRRRSVLPVDGRTGDEGSEPARGAEGGFITVRASGALAHRLAEHPSATLATDELTSQRILRLEVPVAEGSEVGSPANTVSSLLEQIARLAPRARPWLLRDDGAPLPAVLIAGRSVPGSGEVKAGEELELLLVIPGG